ncbi:hypothetical protein D0T49_02105 [Paludibacter sp. 221]|uniref:hypothetical protein n=1 Tax=Paludibacter sp. 221 TaxID=2302939 RepID=UPI0013D0B1F6|nr:hypothetical protein [Paludibacter sp. 221]NDV45843.1 hypothetical protein [Paludibacter sp. 221]
MKKKTLIACVFVVVALLAWYFYQRSVNNKVEVSVVGMNCDKTMPEVYLLVMNSSKDDVSGNINLTFTDKETKGKFTVPYTMKRAVEAREFKQDTAFISNMYIKDFDCERYEVKAKMSK